MDKALKSWAENLMNEVDAEWKKHRELKKSGYAVFYSPPHRNPDLMIIGYNPGGDGSQIDQQKMKTIPTVHDYLAEDEPYPLAKKMIALLAWKKNLLEQSVKLNLLFFPSVAVKDWVAQFSSRDKKEAKALRRSLEDFCEKKVLEIVTELKPKVIIAEGISTYDRLKSMLDGKESTTPIKNGNRRIFAVAQGKGPKLIGILHLSGARPRTEDIALIENAVKQAIGK